MKNFCEQCGAKLREGAAFCGKCGASTEPQNKNVKKKNIKNKKIKEKKTGKKVVIIATVTAMTALVVAVTVVMFVMTGTCILHDWQEATCTEPKICSKCGEIEGAALGHSWEEASCTEAKTCSVCRETEGEALGHNWQEATCYSLQTCRTCGETTGSYATHQWSEATCQRPATCSLCGETTGGYGDHQWKEATCQELATCNVCGETTGSYADHRMGDDCFCTVCGKQLGVLLTNDNVSKYFSAFEAGNSIIISPKSDYAHNDFVNIQLTISYKQSQYAGIGRSDISYGTKIVNLSRNGYGSVSVGGSATMYFESMTVISGYICPK